MESFAIVIVLYYPDGESVANLLKLGRTNQSTLIIVDNSSPPVGTGGLESNNKIIIRNNKNIGLAAALNKGIEIAGQMGFENIFLLDQDTRVPDSYFDRMLDFKNSADEKESDYALYVPNFYDRNSKTYANFPVLKKYSFRHYHCDELPTSTKGKAIIAITSGSLISYSKHQRIGPLQKDYFIDFIDNEYCLRLSLNGFSVAVNCALILDHSIGNRTSHRFFGITFKPNHHSPVRRYFISRNGVVTVLRYFKSFRSYAFLIILRLCHEYLSIIIFEKLKKEKLYASFKGLQHGLKGRLGPYSF